MSADKRRRKKENRKRARDAELALPELTDDDLAGLLSDITVRADCEHAHTKTTNEGDQVLIRCEVGAAVAGGCPRDCARFERRRVGGTGFGIGGPGPGAGR